MLEFSLKLYKSTYNNTSDVYLESAKSYFLTTDHTPQGHYDINAKNYAVTSKFFKRQYVAPWGKYFLLGLTYNTYTTKYSPDQMFVPMKVMSNTYLGNYNYIEFSDFGPTEKSFQYFDVMMGNGKNRIFLNRIVLDYGYNFNLIATTLTFIDVFEGLNLNAADYIPKTSHMRVRGINRFNFFVKLGYLF